MAFVSISFSSLLAEWRCDCFTKCSPYRITLTLLNKCPNVITIWYCLSSGYRPFDIRFSVLEYIGICEMKFITLAKGRVLLFHFHL
jgi:hypothetical protein